jgi:tRNA1Val (adenine37-N6)-methyltransferase
VAELSRDAFFDGRLTVLQPCKGYRFSIDAILLAATVTPQPGENLLDLGTGCGIIALILALRYPALHISAVEIQPDLAFAARQNVAENRMDARVAVIQADLRTLPSPQIQGPFDWVISNPPFRRPDSGRINPDSQRAVARHEIEVNMEQLMACAGRMLRTGGRFVTIYPAERAADLIERMRLAEIEPKLIQTVHSRCGQDAKLVLAQGIKGGRPGSRIAAPLVVYQPDGSYTKTVQAMMKP